MLKKVPRPSFLQKVPIATKLYFTVGIMAVLIAMELFTLFFAINTLSSVRAYVGGEGLWSKAQKDALYQLQRYNRTHDENAYGLFLEHMKVPFGDHKARLELLKKNPDLDIIRQGFIEGRIHPDDLDGEKQGAFPPCGRRAALWSALWMCRFQAIVAHCARRRQSEMHDRGPAFQFVMAATME